MCKKKYDNEFLKTAKYELVILLITLVVVGLLNC